MLVLGILFSIYDLSVSYLVFFKKVQVSTLFTLATNLSYTFFLTTWFFTTSLRLLKSTGTGTNLSISNFSASVFKPAKFDFNAKLEVSINVILLSVISVSVA